MVDELRRETKRQSFRPRRQQGIIKDVGQVATGYVVYAGKLLGDLPHHLEEPRGLP